jgi:hypothetical protein
VVRVLAGLDEVVATKPVDGRLHALAGQAHAPTDLRNGQRPLREGERAEDLPPRRGEALPRRETVTRGKQASVRAEGLEDDLGGRLAFGCAGGPGHDKSLP